MTRSDCDVLVVGAGPAGSIAARRLAMQGVNVRKKHQRAMQQQGGRQINPGIIEFEAPFALSNVMLVCPNCSKPARVGVRRSEDGKAHRVCKNCGKDID